MRFTNDVQTLNLIVRRSLPVIAFLALAAAVIACAGDMVEDDQTVAPTATSVPAVETEPTVISRSTDTPVPTAATEPTVTSRSTDAPVPAAEPKPTETPAKRDEPVLVRSDKSRDDSPDATAGELAELVDGNSAFAFDLFHALRETSAGNLFYSPYSISLALAMAYSGAAGETERQMADTLHFDLPQTSLHPAFNALDLELAPGGGETEAADDRGFTLNIANAVWGQEDYEFLGSFLDVLAENYGAGVRPVDFKDEVTREESRHIINDWVADQTRDRIKDLVPKNAINNLTRMILTNAIYFNAGWSKPFDEDQPLPFHRLNGLTAITPMMKGTTWYYGSGDGYQAVSVPYRKQRVSMSIILPDLGRFEEIESSMDAPRARQILGGIERVGGSVELTMPKFEFGSGFKLAETLKAMGMPNAFDKEASEFEGMDGRSCLAGDLKCLFISDVIHKAFVSMDERGTEAAAATGVIVERQVTRVESVLPIIPVVVDRPFIFLVRDEETGAILFVGSVVELGDETKLAPAPTPQPTAAAVELRSNKERAAPSAARDEIAELVDGNSKFAFDLYRTLAEEDGNLFYSPYSMSLALAMTYAGARGETERQFADTLHFDLPQARLHPAFNALDADLASRGGEAEGKDDEGFTLNIANAVWGHHDYAFLEPFLDVLAENYGAGVRPVDFVGSPEESRIRINDWVADQTEDRIKDLIPKEAINNRTRMVLTNAIYFKAAWNYPFKTSMAGRPFYLLDGSLVGVPMMRQTESLGYVKGDGYELLDLPYDGLKTSMTILIPNEGTFRAFEQTMDAALISRILEGVEREYVELTMPNFEFESAFRMGDTLEAMGMPDAFDRNASDFSGMDGQSCLAGDLPCLVISEVVHKAFVSVDEEGTEAAAATGVISERVVSGRPEPKKVVVDRPFIFLIRDRATESILFVGRVENPVG